MYRCYINFKSSGKFAELSVSFILAVRKGTNMSEHLVNIFAGISELLWAFPEPRLFMTLFTSSSVVLLKEKCSVVVDSLILTILG